MSWQTTAAQADDLGESPFWHPDERRLYWMDIAGRKLRRANGLVGDLESWDMPSEPGCMAPVRSRVTGNAAGLVIALRDGIYRADEWGGALRCIAPAAHDVSVARFNDGKADPAGRFWAGTLYEPKNAALGQLFCLESREAGAPGEQLLQTKAGGVTTANGIAWAPDARTMYWADTQAHVVRVWDWDMRSGAMQAGRVFSSFASKPPGWQSGEPGYGGRPDGAAVDSAGNYYLAMFEGARLLKLAPDGRLLADIAVPAQCPTMPCFGGDDLRTLYLTTARRGRPAAELAAYPDSGRVFSMRVEVPGLPVNFFLD